MYVLFSLIMMHPSFFFCAVAAQTTEGQVELESLFLAFFFARNVQWVDQGPCLREPRVYNRSIDCLQTRNSPKSNPVWHSGRNHATFLEITRIGIACVQVGIDEAFL